MTTGTQEAATSVAGIRGGPVPKHAQLRAILAQLVAQELGPGAPIPSERELMERYAVSRATVRKAIDGLVGEGALERAHGKGTYVSRPRLASQLHLASFSEDMRRRGLSPSTRLLRLQAARPPAPVVASLGLRGRERAWRIDRLRLADDEPVALERGWYPCRSLPDLDREPLTGSLYALLSSRYGLVIDRAEQTLWAEPADAECARLLGVPSGAPVLVFLRQSRARDLPIEHVVSHYRGDRYSLHMSLSQTTPAAHVKEGPSA